MKKAFIAKNKFGFVDGTTTLSSPLIKTPTVIDAFVVMTWLVLD